MSEEYERQWIREKAPRSPGYDTEGTGTVTSAVDWRGNRFHVGDTVMYCVGAGRGQMMAIGEVKQIKVEKLQRRYGRPATADDPPERIVESTYAPFRYVWDFLPYDEITVQVLTHKTSGRWDNKPRTKPAWVNPMNITAIPQVETP